MGPSRGPTVFLVAAGSVLGVLLVTSLTGLTCLTGTPACPASTPTAGNAVAPSLESEQMQRAGAGNQSLPEAGPCIQAANSTSEGQSEGQLRIPRILHQVFLPSREEYLKTTANPDKPMRSEWADWCQRYHSGWAYRFWDNAMAEAFLMEHYPWFLTTWRQYDPVVLRADALRYFIMLHYGGLYLDLDVECFRLGEDMLDGFDVVLQGSAPGEGVTNGILASAPGHPIWKNAISLLQERANMTLDTMWDVMKKTGPQLVRDALLMLPGVGTGANEDPANPSIGTHELNGTVIKVWPLGTWFEPCFPVQHDCHRELVLNRALGVTPANVVGYHRASATWTTGGNINGINNRIAVQYSIVASIDDRPPALAWVADQPNNDGIFLLPCPLSTWRISQVISASFGAKEPHACNASMAFAAAASACLGRSSCFFRDGATQALLGPEAPCPAGVTPKWEVFVTCTPPRLQKEVASWTASPQHLRLLEWREPQDVRIVLMEGAAGSVICPASDWRIDEVPTVSYSSANGTCSSPRTKPAYDSAYAKSAVEAACIGHSSCQLSANSAAMGGDPCPGAPKQLEVRARCVPRHAVFSRGRA